MTVAVEVENRSGVEIERDEAVALARRVLDGEGVTEGELALHFVAADEIRALKRTHLGVDEATDVLAFPIDARDPVPAGLPRQLGDVILCPDVVGPEWRSPLVHGVLHLLGHEHGNVMAERERTYR